MSLSFPYSFYTLKKSVIKLQKTDKERISDLEITSAQLEIVSNENKRDIEKLQDTTGLLTELKVIAFQNTKQMDRQLEINERQTMQNEKLNLTLTTMDTNLSKLNEEITDINQRVTKIEDGSDRGKFDVIAFISNDVPKYIGIAILAAFLAYLGLR